jgi:guanylate kinase
MSKLIVLAAPSGAGKTTIVHQLLESFDNLAFSISATTRERRPHEVDGTDYYYLSTREFRSHIDADDFVEWEEVYPDQYYGTLRSEVERLWKEGKHIVFDIDVVGALNIKKAYPAETLTIFIQPPSLQVLRERLMSRRTESEHSLRRRLEKAEWELSFTNKFDKIVVNDVLADAVAEARSIVSDFIQYK